MHKKKILFILNSVCCNRGSEAIIRGFMEICRKLPGLEISLSSGEISFGPRVNIPGVANYIRRISYGERASLRRFIFAGCRRLRLIRLADKILYQTLLAEAEKSHLVIIGGGDNYDKSYGMFAMIHTVNSLIKNATRGKMVLYDCSFEEAYLDDDITADIRIFDAVTARETVTLDSLKKRLDIRKVYYFPDPAFAMPKEEVLLPKGWSVGKMVGINISNLITKQKYGGSITGVTEACCSFMEHIIRKTDMNIALIPHVMGGEDLSVLRPMFEKYHGTGRVILVDDEKLTAPQLKYIISNCRFFIGARTHAVIAAYSTCVPTLALGYSVKSIGIARDIFGSEHGMVVLVKDMKSRSELTDAFKDIYSEEDRIRSHLKEAMPAYIGRSYAAAELVRGMLAG